MVELGLWRHGSDRINALLILAVKRDYEAIRDLCGAGERPEGVSVQIWSRMKRVASDHKLLTVDPADLPASLEALLELSKLPEERFRLLRDHGLLGSGMTAERIRAVRDAVPVQGLMTFSLYPDGRVEFGPVVPIGGRIYREY